MQKVLIVEDDTDLAELIQMNINNEQLHITICNRGDRGLEQALSESFDLIILDGTLPGLDGFDICKQLRQHDPMLPIMMLTSRTEEIDRILGLEFGADDYMTKPFSIRELQARIKALLRRANLLKNAQANAVTDEAPMQFGELNIYPQQHKVEIRGNAIELTAKEAEKIQHQIRQLQQVDENRRQFITHISHDLRTRLRGRKVISKR